MIGVQYLQYSLQTQGITISSPNRNNIMWLFVLSYSAMGNDICSVYRASTYIHQSGLDQLGSGQAMFEPMYGSELILRLVIRPNCHMAVVTVLGLTLILLKLCVNIYNNIQDCALILHKPIER